MATVSTQFPINPITIVSQSVQNVTFNISNPFGEDVYAVYYQYAATKGGGLQCYSETDFASCPEPIQLTAQCLNSIDSSLAIVDVWFVDGTVIDISDSSTIPDCCDPSHERVTLPTVHYTFKIYCQSKCDTTNPSRRAMAENGEMDIRNVSEFERVTRDDGIVVPVVDQPKDHVSDNNVKSHFCLAADHPCGDKGKKMVHVCHFSSKDGYQTFCVPESDSDVIAYVPKDYCGPCVGGYGNADFSR